MCCGLNYRVQGGLVRQSMMKDAVRLVMKRLWPQIEKYLQLTRNDPDERRQPQRFVPPGFLFTCRAGRHRSVGLMVLRLVSEHEQQLTQLLNSNGIAI